MKLLLLAALLTFCCHLTEGGHSKWRGSSKSGGKCPLVWKKHSHKKQECISLTPPDDVKDALQSCWSRAINTKFSCMSIADLKKMYMKKYAASTTTTAAPSTATNSSTDGKRHNRHHRHHRHHHHHGGRRNMMIKMMFAKMFMKNFDWMVFFSKDLSPMLYPFINEVTQNKIRTTFKACFLKKTGVEMGAKMINTKQVIEKIKQYKGDESNITTIVNATEHCSVNATTQEELSLCVMKKVIGGCLMKRRAAMRSKYQSKYRSRTELTPTDETEDEKKEREDAEGDDKDEDDEDKDSDEDDDDDDDEEKDKKEEDSKKSSKDRQRDFRRKYSKSYKKCTPCYPLKSSEELKHIGMYCMEHGEANYYSKIMGCMKYDMKKKAEDAKKEPDHFWLKLFKPLHTGSFFMTTDRINKIQSCIFGRLGLGTMDDVSGEGYKKMIKKHLIGNDKVKDILMKNVDLCSTSANHPKVDYKLFTKCILPKLQANCEATA